MLTLLTVCAEWEAALDEIRAPPISATRRKQLNAWFDMYPSYRMTIYNTPEEKQKAERERQERIKQDAAHAATQSAQAAAAADREANTMTQEHARPKHDDVRSEQRLRQPQHATFAGHAPQQEAVPEAPKLARGRLTPLEAVEQAHRGRVGSAAETQKLVDLLLEDF